MRVQIKHLKKLFIETFKYIKNVCILYFLKSINQLNRVLFKNFHVNIMESKRKGFWVYQKKII